ncbi:hypothetical protein B0H15DRAFT_1010611 [Mycena belliarum]|uniref:Uncharacterized protein n=1 Tax=Mycena belliarum TaxID=1033014 RepID=A0AAD6TU65_9AGAR|nr:hypothetical protein B0H15DRAFT_1010611 [Mycena belliae]
MSVKKKPEISGGARRSRAASCPRPPSSSKAIVVLRAGRCGRRNQTSSTRDERTLRASFPARVLAKTVRRPHHVDHQIFVRTHSVTLDGGQTKVGGLYDIRHSSTSGVTPNARRGRRIRTAERLTPVASPFSALPATRPNDAHIVPRHQASVQMFLASSARPPDVALSYLRLNLHPPIRACPTPSTAAHRSDTIVASAFSTSVHLHLHLHSPSPSPYVSSSSSSRPPHAACHRRRGRTLRMETHGARWTVPSTRSCVGYTAMRAALRVSGVVKFSFCLANPASPSRPRALKLQAPQAQAHLVSSPPRASPLSAPATSSLPRPFLGPARPPPLLLRPSPPSTPRLFATAVCASCPPSSPSASSPRPRSRPGALPVRALAPAPYSLLRVRSIVDQPLAPCVLGVPRLFAPTVSSRVLACAATVSSRAPPPDLCTSNPPARRWPRGCCVVSAFSRTPRTSPCTPAARRHNVLAPRSLSARWPSLGIRSRGLNIVSEGSRAPAPRPRPPPASIAPVPPSSALAVVVVIIVPTSLLPPRHRHRLLVLAPFKNARVYSFVLNVVLGGGVPPASHSLPSPWQSPSPFPRPHVACSRARTVNGFVHRAPRPRPRPCPPLLKPSANCILSCIAAVRDDA